MSKWLDTRGNKPIAIRVCARCGIKHAYTDLMPDPNYPGIYVCQDDLDVLDPWRLPARETENISLDQPRPDFTLAPGPYAAQYPQEQAVIGASGGYSMLGDGTQGGIGQYAIGGFSIGSPTSSQPGNPLAAAGRITTLQQPKAWAPNAQVALGAQVTPGDPVGMDAAGQDIYVFEAIIPGKTGASAPNWTTTIGTLVLDNGVLWQCAGIYLP